MKDTVLITGASSGIGLHLAKEFARHGHPLVLIARIQSELDEVAAQLTKSYGVDVDTVAKDLNEAGSAEEIYEHTSNLGVDILINNAGHGQKGKFWEIPLEKDISMIRVNVEAVVRLTRLFLADMLKNGYGRIMNTASVAGFEPGPLFAVYSATKAFVLSFSESLATELEGKGITVTALCPGPTDTDFYPKAGMLGVRGFQKGHLMAPQDVAAAAYKSLMAGERVVVPGLINKAMVFSRRILPESTQAKINQKLYEDVKPAHRQRHRGEKEMATEE